MANGQIAKATTIGAASGIVAGPIGSVAGATVGYLSASGIFGGKKKTKTATPIAIYKQPIFYEVGGVAIGIIVLVFLVIRKKQGV